MGTSEFRAEYISPECLLFRWEHAALWAHLSARQGIASNVRKITVSHRSWLSWAGILDSVQLALDELHIANGAWESLGKDYAHGTDREMLVYEKLDCDPELEMRALSFASLRRVVVENKCPRAGSGRSRIEYLLDRYVHCTSAATKPIPVCYCDAVVIPDDRSELASDNVERSEKGDSADWRFCDRTCYYPNRVASV
ncbi:hypothetical protein AURDEDRAFT_170441 [Auricularia subglabra TFB-10046 SS5]|nr:hypothetical protein AURDEDRAFT_170441 [Auricularia subglabra TFB-10046 SS5]